MAHHSPEWAPISRGICRSLYRAPRARWSPDCCPIWIDKQKRPLPHRILDAQNKSPAYRSRPGRIYIPTTCLLPSSVLPSSSQWDWVVLQLAGPLPVIPKYRSPKPSPRPPLPASTWRLAPYPLGSDSLARSASDHSPPAVPSSVPAKAKRPPRSPARPLPRRAQ